jgi:hypothetical protein
MAISKEELAIRAHDVVASMERQRAPEYEGLQILGLSVRLALHLRGVPPLPYETVKQVAVYLLNFNPAEVRPVLTLLAEAEFVTLDTEGSTIKTVVPNIPFFENLYAALGEVGGTAGMTETEQLTMHLAHSLAATPLARDTIYNLGAEKKLVENVLRIGSEGAFFLVRRARGRDIVVSPTYFAENENAYADLVAAQGAGRVQKVLNLLRTYQGWPLAMIERESKIAGIALDQTDLATIRALAGEGFFRPPAIETSHHGTNYFLFGPRPGGARLPLTKKATYEAAMALVAAVRQGQLLPDAYAIRYPVSLLSALRDRGVIGANSEALEQYQQVAQLRVCHLQHVVGDRYQLVLNKDRPENIEAVNLAIELVQGSGIQAKPEDDVILALRQGQTYVESLIGRKRLVQEKTILDADATHDLLTQLYGGKI